MKADTSIEKQIEAVQAEVENREQDYHRAEPTSAAEELAYQRYEALEAALETLKRSRWIPVTERLPVKIGDVLVTNGQVFEVAMYYTAGEWDFYGNVGWKDEDVTHWLPLPPPPDKE